MSASEKRKILIQLDADVHASVFDRVVAIDAGVDELFSYASVKPEQVAGLIHGAIFTRHPRDLKRTAVFVGGSDVTAAEALVSRALEAMIPAFGLRVSVLLDANGANTTAAAAVRVAGKHLALASCRALVLGGTGPVGQRVGLLLAQQGADVRLASRKLDRAAATAEAISKRVSGARITPVAVASEADLPAVVADRQLIVAAGAAGVVLLPRSARAHCRELAVAIDLNAVPPLGVEGVQVTDTATERDGVVYYGAIGVGGTKMKLHRAAIAKLFDANDQVMDAEQVYALGEGL